jgi:hypothetical protein
MQLACPSCGTRDVRVSHPHGLGEYLKYLAGVFRLRCRRCDNRWETSLWANRSWKYARCPRCYRQELTKWTAQYYSPTRWTRFLLRIGASPRRCPACRCNFASFRPQKKDFSWRHQIRETIPQLPAQGTGMLVAEHTPPGEGSGEQMP